MSVPAFIAPNALTGLNSASGDVVFQLFVTLSEYKPQGESYRSIGTIQDSYFRPEKGLLLLLQSSPWSLLSILDYDHEVCQLITSMLSSVKPSSFFRHAAKVARQKAPPNGLNLL